MLHYRYASASHTPEGDTMDTYNDVRTCTLTTGNPPQGTYIVRNTTTTAELFQSTVVILKIDNAAIEKACIKTKRIGDQPLLLSYFVIIRFSHNFCQWRLWSHNRLHYFAQLIYI